MNARQSLLCLASLLLASAAPAAPARVFRGLPLLAGTHDCSANGVSNDGRVVVGHCDPSQPDPQQPSQLPVRWDPVQGVQGLGVLPDATDCSATAVSGDGAVVFGNCAFASGTTDPFRWDAAHGMQDLGRLPGMSYCSVDASRFVSLDGSVATGDCSTATTSSEGFRWDASGMHGLGFLAGDVNSHGGPVSSDGTFIVGESDSADYSTSEAYRWDAVHGMQNLDALMGLPNCGAFLISSDGSVAAGECSDADGSHEEAFRWDTANGIQGLGIPAQQTETFAEALSGDGSVVAFGADSGDGTPQLAFRWDAVNGSANLGMLAGFESCYTSSLSRDGALILGVCIQSLVNPATFVWDAQNGMRDLRDALIGDGNDLTGWELPFAPLLTPDGRILVGSGAHTDHTEAWIAPEASAAGEALAAFACLGLLARRAGARPPGPLRRRG